MLASFGCYKVHISHCSPTLIVVVVNLNDPLGFNAVLSGFWMEIDGHTTDFAMLNNICISLHVKMCMLSSVNLFS